MLCGCGRTHTHTGCTLSDSNGRLKGQRNLVWNPLKSQIEMSKSFDIQKYSVETASASTYENWIISAKIVGRNVEDFRHPCF